MDGIPDFVLYGMVDRDKNGNQRERWRIEGTSGL